MNCGKNFWLVGKKKKSNASDTHRIIKNFQVEENLIVIYCKICDMLRLLFDHDFNHDILRGLKRRIPELNYLTPEMLGNIREKDANHLIWAANENRVIITHDVNTFVDAANERLRRGEKMFGLITVPQTMPIGDAIIELEIIEACA